PVQVELSNSAKYVEFSPPGQDGIGTNVATKRRCASNHGAGGGVSNSRSKVTFEWQAPGLCFPASTWAGLSLPSSPLVCRIFHDVLILLLFPSGPSGAAVEPPTFLYNGRNAGARVQPQDASSQRRPALEEKFAPILGKNNSARSYSPNVITYSKLGTW